MSAALDSVLRAAVAAGDVPGVIGAVTDASGTTYARAEGLRVLGRPEPMRMDTVLRIHSMTKPIVGAAALQLVERGRVGLDDPAAKLIPELGQVQVMEGYEAGRPRFRAPRSPVTLRNLLTHTAGYTYDIWNPVMARYMKENAIPRAGSGQKAGLAVPLLFDPGTRWEYGINIDWAGQLVEAASGQRLGQYLQENLFGPLGMGSTAFRPTDEMQARMALVHQRQPDGGFSVNPPQIPAADAEFEPGGGGLYSTAEDYLRFMRMILNGGRGNGNAVMKPETVALMAANSMGALRVNMLPTQNPSLSLDAEFFPGLPKSWGLSFMINEADAPTGRSAGSLAWAGLANTFFWIDPKKGLAGLLMSQVLPFVDPRALGVFTAFERAVYKQHAPGN